jgi:dipeptidyl aminopeptidase/acylaminoacyl peptidase
MMNKLIILLSLSVYAIDVLPQAVLDSGQQLKSSNKPAIDTSDIGKWPRLGTFIPPIVSHDGNFVAYGVSNYPLGNNTLVVQTINGSFKKNIIANRLRNEDVFFSGDDTKFLWKKNDSLGILHLKTSTIEYLTDILSFAVSDVNKGEWLGYTVKDRPKLLVMKNVLTGQEMRYDHVEDWSFKNGGQTFILKTLENDADRSFRTFKWLDYSAGTEHVVWSGDDQTDVLAYCFNNQYTKLSLLISEKKGNSINLSLWYYTPGMVRAVLKVDNNSSIIPSGFELTNSTPFFSTNGEWVFFDINSCNKEEKQPHELSKVDIWSYKDEIIFPDKPFHSNTKNLKGGIHINSSNICLVSKENEILETYQHIAGDHVIVIQNANSAGFAHNVAYWWPHSPKPSYILRSLLDGKEFHLKKNGEKQLKCFCFSPSGRYLVYWDSEVDDYMSFDIETQKSINLTQRLPLSFANENIQSYISEPVEDVVGWLEDSCLIVYDQFDIWKIDPSGQRPAVNLTNGYGAKNRIKLRFVYPEKINTVKSNEKVLVTGFNVTNKYNGFFLVSLNGKGDPHLQTMGPFSYYKVSSQKGHGYTLNSDTKPVEFGNSNNRGWIISRQSASEFPNFYHTKDFKAFQSITNFQPQTQCNWLTTELINFKQLDGTLSQGILYKPENFNPKKKYPVIFNYYEKLTHRRFEFPKPGLTSDNINIPWFVSRGYLVFTPDIQYSVAASPGGKTTGEAALNTMEGAAQYLARLPFVDARKLGLQGQSFGGHQTAYIVTHSTLFAAASEMAGGTDPISGYLTLVGEDGRNADCSEHFHKQDHPLGRMGATPWERPDLYIRNSSVLSAHRAVAPLLIVHNKRDGSINFRQGVELYLAMRRLGKKCWLFQYDESSHGLVETDAFDFTLRLTQFFDHYLKGQHPPVWLMGGVPVKSKADKSDFDLDNSGRKP